MTDKASHDDFVRLPEGHVLRAGDYERNWHGLRMLNSYPELHSLIGVQVKRSDMGFYCLRSDYPQPERVLSSPKTFSSVQEMLDDINPELAEEFRAYAKRPTVRLRKWWILFRMRWRWHSQSDKLTREVIDE
jgi:hypothetical protein